MIVRSPARPDADGENGHRDAGGMEPHAIAAGVAERPRPGTPARRIVGMPVGVPLGSLLASRIVGREEPLAILDRLLDEPARSGALISLVGGAGLGKTRLARFAIDRAEAHGRRVIAGRADPDGGSSPLGVIQDALRDERRRNARLRVPRDPLAAEFPARLLPELGGAPGPTLEPGALFEAAARYCVDRARGRGLLLVLEDLHWADATSLELVRYLARATRQEPVLLLLTHRPEELQGDTALARLRLDLRRHRLARELVLSPLGDEQSREMLVDILGLGPDPDAEAELLRLAGGNPFVLEELVGAAVEAGRLDPSSGRWAGGGVPLPWTLTELFDSRLRRLSPNEGELLAWAAVVGERFNLALVARAFGLAELEAERLAAALCRNGMLVDGSADPLGRTLAFRHALTREAVLGHMLTLERRRRAARVLQAAEALYADLGEEKLAEELLGFALQAGDRAKAFALSWTAARGALKLSAYAEAGGHYERARQLWTRDEGLELRAELLLEYGRHLARTVHDGQAVAVLQDARLTHAELGNQDQAAAALALLGEARWIRGEPAAALEDLRAARAQLEEGAAPQARLTVVSAQARVFELAGLMTAAASAASEALALVPDDARPDHIAERIHILTTLGRAASETGEPERGEAILVEARDLALQRGDWAGALLAFLNLSGVHLSPAESVQDLEAAIALARRWGLRQQEARLLANRAGWATEAGALELAHELLSEAGRLVAVLDPEPMANVEWQRVGARLAYAKGSMDEALVAARRALADAETLGDLDQLGWCRCELALITLRTGDIAGAQEMLRIAEAERVAAGRLPDRFLLLTEVETAVVARDWARSASAADQLSRLAPGVLADYAAVLARLNRAHIAVAGPQLQAAADALEAEGWRFEAAHARLSAAHALLAREAERDAAADLAIGALERFRAMGASGWCQRCESLLRGLGRRAPRRRSGAEAAGLSVREREVLGLLVEGLSNRAIADRLVISPGTAVRHVANIYAKLGVHTRAQAVRVVMQQGLLDPARERSQDPSPDNRA
jgi:DNA-binding CsgD family transcriptional regulator